jgi:mRNA interferase RelE/StbE
MIFYKSYKIIIEKKAQKYLESLIEATREKIVSMIQCLTSPEIQKLNIKKLQGYKNLYRITIDDYRVIFVVISTKKMILIPVIGHRKEIYDIVKRMSF